MIKKTATAAVPRRWGAKIKVDRQTTRDIINT